MNGLFLAFKSTQWARLCSKKMLGTMPSWYSIEKKGFNYKKEEIYFPPGTSELEITAWADLAKEQTSSFKERYQIDEIVKMRLSEMDSADALGNEMKETAAKISQILKNKILSSQRDTG